MSDVRHSFLDLVGKGGDLQKLGDGRACLADDLGQLLLRVAVRLQQAGESLGLLERPKILPLQVLDDSKLVGVAVGDDRGDRRPGELLHGSIPALAGDQEVLVLVRDPLDGNGLQKAMLLDRACELRDGGSRRRSSGAGRG